MFRIVAIAALAALAGCATKPITSDEFVTHGRFKAEQCEAAAPKLPLRRGAVPAKADDFPPPAEHPDVARCRHEAREKAFAECRAQALQEGNRAGQQYHGPGLAGAISQSIAARQTAILTVASCMDAKGFAWTTPRQ